MTCTCFDASAFSCSAAIQRTDDSGTPMATASAWVMFARQ